ncbi:flagellar hook-basal body complex protein FliE [Idiomarina xiamenensis]|uniref:Flagellar hook-basal body complex protein FliE n=1 Tax=Idiomarina xiamenensis 10-D-4 TaxID=740709 RepID=K2KCL1_9GAMM|nr:flagellar hook-basal body complex protein FliE [Idiomarina xiamenensis]EKE80509.1 flagellar hook-basal body protein [Idiomarina xiamenensis 10-D-4]
MKIQASDMYAELQSLAAQARKPGALDTADNLRVGNTSQNDFSTLLKGALDNVNALQQSSGELKNRVELGDPNVSLEQAMIASQKAGIAFEATVQVRNKLVEAYKEIMAMPV